MDKRRPRHNLPPEYHTNECSLWVHWRTGIQKAVANAGLYVRGRLLADAPVGVDCADVSRYGVRVEKVKSKRPMTAQAWRPVARHARALDRVKKGTRRKLFMPDHAPVSIAALATHAGRARENRHANATL